MADPASAGPTPVMAQFLEMKAAHPDCLLFFRMGDFYELFFDDAPLAAEALGIALTKRGSHGGEPIPMCGVPIHHAERHLQELIRKGFRVAVAEQVEDPAEARKRGSKAVVKREVVRVVTPGTLTEDALLDHGSHNHLAAYAQIGAEGALAWTDMSTGELDVAVCPPAALDAEIARIAPREIVLSRDAPPELQRRLEAFGVAVAPLGKVSFDPGRGDAKLRTLLGVGALDAYGAFPKPAMGALGALYDYLDLTQRGRLPLLNPPRLRPRGETMRMDAATRRNLELTRAFDGGRAASLLGAVDRTVTGAGARLLEARIGGPTTDLHEIAARHDAVAHFSAQRPLRETLRTALKRVPDVERALARLGLGRGGPRDLAQLRDGLKAAAYAAAALSAADAAAPTPAPDRIREAIVALTGHDALIDLLEEAIVDEPPLRLSDGGAVAEGYDPSLDEARALKENAEGVIAELQRRYQSLTEIPALKIKTNAVLGRFIETPATHARRMMAPPLSETFSHRQTMANAVRFTTSELAALEAKIASADARAAELEKRAFDHVAGEAIEAASAIAATAQAIAAMDVAASWAELADLDGWTRPIVEIGRAFEIVAGRHPVVEAALKRSGEGPFVANDCDLSADRSEDARPIWLVTGPNMAGKSTFLRQNALIAVLAQAGGVVPAETARIGVVDQLFSRVGAADDLARGRSTFMVEMVETAAILNQASEKALVILDEIGRGTATYDGLAIAWATLEHLDGVNRCRALFATHYHELTALAAKLDGVANVTVAVREWKGDIVFLREIRAGAADRSYGVQVAKLAGLPRAVTDRAKTLLETLERGEDGPAARAARLVDDLPLFAATERAQPEKEPAALTRLRALDPDSLSPREALDALYALRGLIDDDA